MIRSSAIPLTFITFLLSLASFGMRLSAAEKPNIIVILLDDMGWSDIGAFGGEIETPNLDRLANEGFRATQFYNTGKCFPSRSCLLTGLYAQQTDSHENHRDEWINYASLGHVLGGVGYRTLAVGKHHSKTNLIDMGFDHYYGMLEGAANHFASPEYAHLSLDRPNIYKDTENFPNFIDPSGEYYSTDTFTDWAIDLIDRGGDDQPFLLYLAYQAPHSPLQAWPEDIAKYRGRYSEGYQPVRQARYDRMVAMGLIDPAVFPLSNPDYKDWESLTEEEKDEQDLRMAVYAAMIDSVDQNVGRLLDYLEDRGELQNTVIFFMSDNGCDPAGFHNDDGEIGTEPRYAIIQKHWSNVSNTPFRGHKASPWFGGICTPLIVWNPGRVEAGLISDAETHFIDIMPTILELTGAAYPHTRDGEPVRPYEGVSLVPLFAEGGEIDRGKPLFFQWKEGYAMIEDGWKATAPRGWDSYPGLYHIAQDRTETDNLANDEPAKLSSMIAQWQEWYQTATARPFEHLGGTTVIVK